MNIFGGCFWQSNCSTVKSAGVYVLWFHAWGEMRCLHFDRKLIQNIAQIIVYYCETKQLLACLNWLIMCFQFQNMFWEKIGCFQFWWKTYTKHCINNCVISHVKRLSLPTLGNWSCAFNFRIWFGKRTNVVEAKNIKNISNFDFVLLLFTLLTFSCLYCSCKLF